MGSFPTLPLMQQQLTPKEVAKLLLAAGIPKDAALDGLRVITSGRAVVIPPGDKYYLIVEDFDLIPDDCAFLSNVFKEMRGVYPGEIEGHCKDCGVDTAEPWERYMVHDEIWAQAGMEALDGHLCVGCLEKRLGRKLTKADFEDVPLNNPKLYNTSERLLSRLTCAEV